MRKQSKTVCVIGAGASGLIAMRELIAEGHNVVCFEKYEEPGGVFYLNEFRGGAYDSTLLTVSNYFMAYSCFPPEPSESRLFWTRQQYAEYLHAFVEHFGLGQFIQFKTEVVSLNRDNDGRCTVKIAEGGDPLQISSHVFDSVAVCSGTHQVPRDIEIAGKEEFAGDIFHSSVYRNASSFKGKNVLCVGLGETGADVSHEIAQVANSCVLSVRHLQPILERFPNGKEHPNDAYTTYAVYSTPSRVLNALSKLQLFFLERFSKIAEVREYAKWNRKAGDLFNHFFTKNEIFFKSIVDGKLKLNTSGIDALESDRVVFNDCSTHPIDTIVLSTGYVDHFRLIAEVEINDVRQLFKHMIHPELGSDIVFIGWARPGAGGLPACSEMQSRYFAQLCSGKLQLPSRAELSESTRRHASFENHMYRKNPSVRSLVHYSTYMHDFARMLGCSPWNIATFLNPRLWHRIWFGSQVSSIYRLYGPHSDNEQAKRTIFKLPIAVNVAEQMGMAVVTLVSRVLTKLRLISGDPRY